MPADGTSYRIDSATPTRRTVLTGTAAIGLGAVLTGCGGQEDTSDNPKPGTPLVATKDVPVAGAVVIKDARVVVVQPEEGVFKALHAACTHQGCLVTVDDQNRDRLTCPCHDSAFDFEGTVLQGPAMKALPEFAVRVDGDTVVSA